MQAALHQYPGSTECDGFIDLLINLVKRSYICVGCTGSPVKRAECAHNVADIRVIDIPIDYVSDDIVRMTLCANFICRNTHAGDVVRLEQRCALRRAHSLAGYHSIENCLNVSRFTHDLGTTGRQPVGFRDRLTACRTLRWKFQHSQWLYGLDEPMLMSELVIKV